MNIETAIQFLESNQPLPPELELGEKIIVFDEIINFLKVNPVPEALDLLLGSFGDGAGFGVYQMVERAVVQYPYKEVVKSLKKHLTNSCQSVRYWNCQIASLFPSEDLILSLSNLLNEDFNIKYHAILALGQIKNSNSEKILRDLLVRENSQELRDLISEFVSPKINPSNL
jgi:HEAT repeat protein